MCTLCSDPLVCLLHPNQHVYVHCSLQCALNVSIMSLLNCAYSLVMCRLICPGLCIYAKVFNHYHRIIKALTLTKLSAVSAAFFSVTSSLDGFRDDREH